MIKEMKHLHRWRIVFISRISNFKHDDVIRVSHVDRILFQSI